MSTAATSESGIQKKRIVMLLSNPATFDQRPLKEAHLLAREGWPVTILAWDRELETRSDSIFEDGLTIKRMRVGAGHGTPFLTVPKLFLFYAWCLAHLLTTNVGAIHCHDVDTLPAGFAAKALKLNGPKLAYDMHDLPEAFLRFFPFTSLFQRLFLVATRKHGDLLVSASEGYLRYLRTVGLTMRRMVVVLNAPSLKEGRGPRGVSDRLNVVYYGALEEERGVRLLVDAVKGRQDVTLTLAGRGSLGPWVTAAAKSWGNVQFLGWLNVKDLDRVVQDADLIPSFYSPTTANILLSTPNKLLKSFSMSVPAMVAAGTFQAEIVSKFGCGLVVPWGKPEEVGNAIAELARDRKGYERMTRRAYDAFRSELNWEAMETSLNEAYSEMFGGHKATG